MLVVDINVHYSWLGQGHTWDTSESSWPLAFQHRRSDIGKQYFRTQAVFIEKHHFEDLWVYPCCGFPRGFNRPNGTPKTGAVESKPSSLEGTLKKRPSKMI